MSACKQYFLRMKCNRSLKMSCNVSNVLISVAIKWNLFWGLQCRKPEKSVRLHCSAAVHVLLSQFYCNFFCEIDWSYLCLATVWQILNNCKTRTAEIWQKDILTLDGLEKWQLIQLDDFTRIKLTLRNQGQMAPFVCYLVSKIGNFEIDKT